MCRLINCFYHDGDIMDVYVSKKRRPNKHGLSGFDHFPRKADAENAAIRNIGLMIKGLRITRAMSKYYYAYDKKLQ